MTNGPSKVKGDAFPPEHPSSDPRCRVLVLQWSPVAGRSSAHKERGPVHHAAGRSTEEISNPNSQERLTVAEGYIGESRRRD